VIIVATAHDSGYVELANITLPTVERYTKRHGYALYYEPTLPEWEKDAAKARIFLDLFRTGRFNGDDLFMWIDTDAAIMNSAVDLETVAKWGLGSDGHFLWAYDWNGPNSGVWIARFTSHAAHYVNVYDLTARAMGWG